MNEVVARKIASLQRCVARAREAQRDAGDDFRHNYNLQDAAVLNIVRACDTALDLANMLIRKKRLGIPSQSRESFEILMREHLLAPALLDRMKAMVGFRNLAVHQYQELDLAIVESILRKDLDELLAFAAVVKTQFDD